MLKIIAEKNQFCPLVKFQESLVTLANIFFVHAYLLHHFELQLLVTPHSNHQLLISSFLLEMLANLLKGDPSASQACNCP